MTIVYFYNIFYQSQPKIKVNAILKMVRRKQIENGFNLY